MTTWRVEPYYFMSTRNRNNLSSIRSGEDEGLQIDTLSTANDDLFYDSNNNQLDLPTLIRIEDQQAKLRHFSTRTATSWLTATSIDARINSNIVRYLPPAMPEPETNPFIALYHEFYSKNDDLRRSKSAETEHSVAIVPIENLFDLSTRFHLCSAEDDEPLMGILTLSASILACCPLKAFILLGPEHPEFNTAFTPFGRCLLKICLDQGYDLRFVLSDQLFSSWNRLRDLKAFLRQLVECYTDPDRVQWHFDECSICLSTCRFVRKPPCCRKAICHPCWQRYVRSSAMASINLPTIYDLHCYGCNKIVPYNEALNSLEPEDMALVRPVVENSSDKPQYLRCPVCLETSPTIKGSVVKLRRKKGGHPVVCHRCEKAFCAVCGTGVHPTASCRDLIETDKGFKKWMKQRNQDRPEFPNGRRCPKCLIPITREGGCPNMTCKCGTTFCFSCGRRKLNIPLLPGHTSNRLLPLVSCPKLWRCKQQRRLVHSVVSLGCIGALPIALPVGVVAYLVLKIKQKRRSDTVCTN